MTFKLSHPAALLLALVLLCSCRITVPHKDDSLPEKKYLLYSENLRRSYETSDLYQRAIALANLDYDSKVVYKYLRKSIHQHDSVCTRLYEYRYQSDSFNFNQIIVKRDKQRFLDVCVECESKVKYQTYLKETKINELAHAERQKNKKLALDQSLLDLELITILEKVHKRDQAHRGDKRNREIQNHYDSINLEIIEDIFQKYDGYPCLEKVGYEHALAPWLVLQHQGDVKVRLKYTPVLEDAVKKNCLGQPLLDVYNERTEDYIYYENKKKN